LKRCVANGLCCALQLVDRYAMLMGCALARRRWSSDLLLVRISRRPAQVDDCVTNGVLFGADMCAYRQGCDKALTDKKGTLVSMSNSGHQGSSDRPGARKLGLNSRKSGDREDLMSGPTGDLGGLGAPEAPEPTSGPARRFFLCQRVISGRESLFTAAHET
jgi:hypothetical protein